MTRRRHGELFSELLQPVAVKEFLADYFEAQALHIPGPAGKFAGLGFDEEALVSYLDSGSDLEIKAQYFDRSGEHAEVPVTAAQAASLHEAGLTICLSGLEEDHPALARLAADTKTYLNMAEDLDVSCYWSPAGGGFGAHFDCHSVLIAQLEGSKRWRYSPQPAVAHPPTNFLATRAGMALFGEAFPWAGAAQAPADADLAEVELTPGDALYLPAGCWHRTEAGASSLALTVTFRHRTFASLLPALFSARLDASPAWRAPVPLVPLEETPTTGLPPAVEAFFADRLGELRAAVEALGPSDLAALWRAEVAGHRAGPAGPRGGGGKVRRQDVFEVPEPVFCVAAGDSLQIFFGARRAVLPGSGRRFVERLACQARFRAVEATGWGGDGELEWREAREALEALLAAGVIARADEAGPVRREWAR